MWKFHTRKGVEWMTNQIDENKFSFLAFKMDFWFHTTENRVFFSFFFPFLVWKAYVRM